MSGDAVHPAGMRERRGCLLLAGLGNKHVAAALHGAGVRALPPCIETKCFSVTKHPSLFEPRHRGGGGTHAVRLPERAARGNERSANLPAVHGTAESRHRKFTGNCLRAGGCAVAASAALPVLPHGTGERAQSDVDSGKPDAGIGIASLCTIAGVHGTNSPPPPRFPAAPARYCRADGERQNGGAARIFEGV